MDASHFSWRIPGLDNSDPAYNQAQPPLTDHNAYTDASYVGELSVTDVGQLGQGNLPGVHGPSGDNQFTVVDPRRTPEMPLYESLDELAPRRWNRRLPGGYWNPYLFRSMPQEEDTGSDILSSLGSNPWMPGGAVQHATAIVEHGPVTYDELEQLGQIRQPIKTAKNRWWRRLLGFPPKHLDHLGAFDERTIPQVGQIQPSDTHLQDSPAAVGYGNQFVVPDVRRTFDNPKDAPPGTPRDEFGNPVTDKAGFPLTATTLEPSIQLFENSHKYAVDVDYSEFSPDRVRAGVAFATEGRPASMPHWWFFRPFDKLMADHPPGIKGMQAQPNISRPTMTNQELNTVSASGAGGPRYYAPAPGMEAAGLTPNTDRQIPTPWDSQLYVGDTGSEPDTAGRTWRIG